MKARGPVAFFPRVIARDQPARTDRAEKGMTLLELLVALSIFAVVGSVLYPTVMNTISSRRDATERVALDAEARMILDRLEQDLTGNCDLDLESSTPPARFRALAPRSRRSKSAHVLLETTALVARGVTPADAFVGGEDVKALSTDRGDQAQIVWRIDSGGRLVRQELRPPRIEPVDWDDLPVEVLSERASLSMEFYEPEVWLETWDSTESASHRGRAPVAVRTTLEVDGGELGLLELVSTVVLPVVQTSTDLRRSGGGGRK
jgi:prepilin-type N-terminal cleavage/methylation domain-containing protein